MKPIEELLKEAAAAEIRSVTWESIPPLALPARRRRQWPVPLAAAAAMLVVVATALSLSRVVDRSPDALAPVSADAPPYFVSLHPDTGQAAVHDARTDRKITDIGPGTRYTEVVATGDHRTFFLIAQEAACSARIDRARLAADGSIAALTTIRGRFEVALSDGGAAASADGTRLALTSAVGDAPNGCPGQIALDVVDTATGHHRAWRLPAGDPTATVNNPIWTPDDRNVIFTAKQKTDSGMVVRVLDTAAKGTGIDGSRVLMSGAWGDRVIHSLAATDGGTITAVIGDSGDHPVYEVVQLSASNGTVLRRIARLPKRGTAMIKFDATGRHALVAYHDVRDIYRVDDTTARLLLNKTQTRQIGLMAW